MLVSGVGAREVQGWKIWSFSAGWWVPNAWHHIDLCSAVHRLPRSAHPAPDDLPDLPVVRYMVLMVLHSARHECTERE
jgi:hypothetical protein